jgi:hypothetical protein
MLLSLLLSLGMAAAQTAVVVDPSGGPQAGRSAALEVLIWGEDDQAGPALTGARASVGVVEELVQGEAPGLWIVRYAAAAPGEVRLTLSLADGQQLTLPITVAPRAPSGLSAPDTLSVWAGADAPLRVPYTAAGLDPDSLLFVAGEGGVVATEATAGGVDVLWRPAEDQEVRVVAFGALDLRRPGESPRWGAVKVNAKMPIEVKTEPGSSLVVRVGGRSYGPVVAGADGLLALSVEVRAGEVLGEATLEDKAGNRQRTTLTLVRNPRPSLVAMIGGPARQGAAPPPLWVHALDAQGRPWTGETPSCRAAGGERLTLRAVEPGVWSARLPVELVEDAFELRVDCALGDRLALSTARAPLDRGTPARISLAVWPTELTADLPVSQVRASLEDRRGERLNVEGLRLEAEFGGISGVAAEGQSLRADLTADNTGPEDAVIATWRSPPGQGEPWELRLFATAAPGGLLVLARPLDRAGRPLVGRTVTLRVGDKTLEAVTSETGWARWALPTPTGPGFVEAEIGALRRRVIVAPGLIRAVPDPATPELSARVPVTLRVGRVSAVSVSVEPRQVYAGPQSYADVRVMLVDRAGRAVPDEALLIETDLGQVEPARPAADGGYVARWTPPPGVTNGLVGISVRSVNGAFPETQTSLDLLPRPISLAPAVSLGWITSLGAVNAPRLGVQLDRRVADVALPLYARVGLGWYMTRSAVSDPDRGGEVSLSAQALSVSGLAVLRRERGPWASWIGGGLGVTPLLMSASLDGAPLYSGLGMPLPGPVGVLGAGRRWSNGEVFGELGGYGAVLRGSEFGYEGQLGGFAFSLGYRIIY